MRRPARASRDRQAAFLYTVARHLGYDVRLYDGSFIDWSRTQYPVER